jgi:hypothetical protein
MDSRCEQERDMNMNKPVSKVLVLDDCPAHKEALKRFCDENNLVGVKVGKNRLQSVLRSNIDLGAVLFAGSERRDRDQDQRGAPRVADHHAPG